MKKKGLKNRFPKSVKEWWVIWSPYTDMWDGQNDGDVLHHIKSPSSMDYKSGVFNTSLFNSTLLNNFRNHIGNGKIHSKENERELLKRTFTRVSNSEYEMKDIDIEFLKQYDLI